MINIAIGAETTTLVTVYEVDTTLQQRLVDLLTAAHDQWIARQPGFISAHVLRGLDGTRVVGYTQWESRAAAEAMLHSDELWPTFIQIQRIAVADPWFYEVAFAALAPSHDTSGE
jgi:heme-degrading monooxygenase HmoA